MTPSEDFTDQTPAATILHVVLEGDAARLEDVPAQDIARLIEGAIRSIARAAELVSGRTPGLVSRRGAAVEEATRFRLVEIRAGSVAVVLRAPERATTSMGLELEDERLTELAINQTLDALEGDFIDIDPSLASALANLGDELGVGVRYETVRFDVGTRSGVVRTCRLDQVAHTRLRQIVQKPLPAASSAVYGTLVEADFENFTARLRTPTNRRVKIAFTNENADVIQNVLRQKAEFDGVVTYDPNTKEALSVEMHSVVRTDQVHLELDESGFWGNFTVAELAAEQGVVVSEHVSDLHAADIGHDDFDSFFEVLGL